MSRQNPNIPDIIKGVAALTEAIDTIGGEDKTDHDMAKIIVEAEMPLRNLVKYALDCLAAEH